MKKKKKLQIINKEPKQHYIIGIRKKNEGMKGR
jgi:hypothetical protein